MHLLNLLINADRAHLVVDAHNSAPLAMGGVSAGSRLQVLALAGVVLAGRGSISLPAAVAGSLQRGAASFDACAAQLGRELDGLVDLLQYTVRDGVVVGEDLTAQDDFEHELVMLGWSDHRQRVLALHAHKTVVARRFTVVPLDPADCMLVPALAGVTDDAEIHTESDLLAISRRQAAAWNQAHPLRQIAGPLQLAEVRRGAVCVSVHPLLFKPVRRVGTVSS